ncbi:MAG: response regulator, partial [Acidobacteriaceae bacterium]|nr:response regulator [Acidobacteriaceae bacterium]
TFHFTVGLTTADASAAREPLGLDSPRTRFKILLAEDNPVNQLVATRMLERDGHSVMLAQNGCEALDVLATEQFDLVLMDVEMPLMDGLEATRRIRARERGRGRHVPIMAMTANASKADELRCLSAGMDKFLTKPFTAEKLRLAIESFSCATPEA